MNPTFFHLIILSLSAGAAVGVIARFAMGRSLILWFVYGVALWPIATIHLAVLGFLDKSGSTAPKVAAAMILAAGGIAAYAITTATTGFSDADIERAKADIHREFSSRNGVTVTEVVLLRDGSQKLSGFAKLDVSGTPVFRNCSALMDDTTNQFIWRCE